MCQCVCLVWWQQFAHVALCGMMVMGVLFQDCDGGWNVLFCGVLCRCLCVVFSEQPCELFIVAVAGEMSVFCGGWGWVMPVLFCGTVCLWKHCSGSYVCVLFSVGLSGLG